MNAWLSSLSLLLATLPTPSSHREAPFITEHPKVDGTDFYLFRSYEPGREDYVTLVADYLPLQDPYGGPNFFAMDPDALYEIHVDNDGDGREDITFQFRFRTERRDLALDIGPASDRRSVAVPLENVGPITARDTRSLNVLETYEANVVYGDRRSGAAIPLVNARTGATVFAKPADDIGTKSIADYATYARLHVHDVRLPNGSLGRMFVGQRKDPFVVALGKAFDLVNLNPVGAVDANEDKLSDKNVTALVLELPIDFLTAQSPTIGAWTTASLRRNRTLRTKDHAGEAIEAGPWVQVSRLGMPLVNELVIGLKDKDRFNGSEPKDDAQFLTYVTHPTLPALLEALFGVTAPTAIPRQDLVQVFLTGVPGLNATATPCEVLRLNTSIAPTPLSMQNDLGVLGGDSAGFPNGRRPGDDVVDAALRVVMGVLLPAADAPSGQLPYTDGAYVDATFFEDRFPYLRDPIPGSVD
jgi:hypothetical protein